MTGDLIVDRFLDSVSRHADRPAVVGDAGPVTYAQLASAAGGVAEMLAGSGVRPGDRVGLLTTHGADTIAAILGTLATGAAYVPLDPGYPPDRLSDMARHADLAALLAAPGVGPLAGRLTAAPVLWQSDATPAELRTRGRAPLGAPAYLLFTSGSTGRPKAVAQPEAALRHGADNQIAALSITREDRHSLLASFSFDAAIPDIFPALLAGAAVVPMDIRGRGLAHVATALVERAVTIYHSTPTVLRYLLDTLGPDGRLPDVRVVLLGGEPVTRVEVVRALRHVPRGCLIINGYGATEATFMAHGRFDAEAVEAAPEGVLPIGHALPGYELTLADSGEITVSGPHVAPGYWRDAEQSAGRFRVAEDVVTYRTGDLGERLPDGRLRCLGRIDRQIKIRGLRVEPAEVEAHLEAAPGIRRAVVVGHEETLVAYVQATAGAPDAATLRARLTAQLPDYLVPGAIMAVEEWPLTPTGKVDVAKLPPPYPPAGPGPEGPVQRAVHDEWCAVLGRAGVGTDEAFFDAGGHSLLLERLRQRLEARFGRPVPLVRLFEMTTIRAQAALLSGALGAPHTPSPTAAASAPRAVPVHGAVPVQGAWEAVPEWGAAAGADRTGEEIAVVGMAGRFPGAASTEALWWNLCAGVDAIHDYTDAELAELGIGPALRADPRHVKAGGRLPGVDLFDADLFGFGEGEAARTDPQHRLLLECAWEALEDAGCDPDRFDGAIGVFASASVNRYFLFHLLDNPALGCDDPDDWEGRLVPHQFADHLAGQIAYRLGLTGPAMAVQTACSSSLVAVCLAAQSLLDFRCDLALAGGASVTWPRYRYAAGGLVSPDGRCRAFDAGAAGSGFSSGAGVVALKRLADAEADGDTIYAVLPGWSVTNDGAARGGFAVPGIAGQVAAVTEALACAEVRPDEVGFVEAHGSGTPLGDAIEVAALTRAYQAAGVDPRRRIALGSIKTGIGHLDAASGVAGLIKAVLAVHHGRIPANLHFTAVNPEIDLAGGPFTVPVKTTDWPPGRRMAGVSALGLGGTNAHVIVAEAAAPGRATATAGPWSLALSAHTPTALREVATRLRAYLTEHPDVPLGDVAHTLATGRRRLRQHAVVTAGDRAEAIAALHPDRLVPDAAPWPTGTRGRRVRLPAYPFQRERHWIDAPKGGTG